MGRRGVQRLGFASPGRGQAPPLHLKVWRVVGRFGAASIARRFEWLKIIAPPPCRSKGGFVEVLERFHVHGSRVEAGGPLIGGFGGQLGKLVALDPAGLQATL